MSKTIYLCTCKDAYEEEKIAFTKKEDAERFLVDCFDYAFEEEEIDKDAYDFAKKDCLDQWHMETENYYAHIETVELFD